MLQELPPAALRCAAHLFEAPYLEPVLQALAAGNSHGRIWVDHQTHPTSAFLWSEESQYYLAGRSDNQVFNNEIRQVVCDLIAPAPDSYMVIYTDADGWAEVLPGIFTPRVLLSAPRYLYQLTHLQIPDWRMSVPEGYQVLPIDRQLLSRPGLLNIEPLVEEIQLMWPSIDRFVERSFGYCTIYDGNEIACWCTGEYAYEQHIGIGIETAVSHQRKRIASLTASAFAQHCLSNGISAHWDCWARNVASARTAEKVGFTKSQEYNVFWGKID